jgi:hypothetical protein
VEIQEEKRGIYSYYLQVIIIDINGLTTVVDPIISFIKHGFSTLEYLYSYGASLTVQKPAVALLSSGMY